MVFVSVLGIALQTPTAQQHRSILHMQVGTYLPTYLASTYGIMFCLFRAAWAYIKRKGYTQQYKPK